MKTSLLFLIIGLFVLTGCVSTNDLEEFGVSLQSNHEELELKLSEQQNQDRQDFQTRIDTLQGSIDSSLKKQEIQLISSIDDLGEKQQQDLEVLRKEFQGGDQSLESSLKKEFKKIVNELHIGIVSSQLKQEEIQKNMDAIKVKYSALKSAYEDEIYKINSQLKEINEAIDISRSIQDVKVSFGRIKNRIEDSRNRVESQELILRQLEGQMQRTERSNLLLEKDILELDGRMKELVKLMEKRQQKNSIEAKRAKSAQKDKSLTSD